MFVILYKFIDIKYKFEFNGIGNLCIVILNFVYLRWDKVE